MTHIFPQGAHSPVEETGGDQAIREGRSVARPATFHQTPASRQPPQRVFSKHPVQ